MDRMWEFNIYCKEQLMWHNQFCDIFYYSRIIQLKSEYVLLVHKLADRQMNRHLQLRYMCLLTDQSMMFDAVPKYTIAAGERELEEIANFDIF